LKAPVVEAILRHRKQNPGCSAKKVREALLSFGVCEEKTLPSAHAINSLGDGYGNKVSRKKNPRSVTRKLVMKFCGKCDFQTKIERDLDQHSFEVHETNRLCTKCGHLSNTYDEFIEHLRTHPVTCPICNRIVAMECRRSLELHMSAMHKSADAEREPKVPCDICGKVMKEESLKVHLKLHEEKTLQCDVCELKFIHKGDLNRHRKEHFKQVTPCPICKKDVKQLRDHIYRMHSGEKKRESCDMCDQTFALKSGLKRHINSVHYNIKDFECDLCSFKTNSASNLRAHKTQVHEKRKWYEICQFCEKRTGNMEHHMKIYHFAHYQAMKTEDRNDIADHRFNC